MEVPMLYSLYVIWLSFWIQIRLSLFLTSSANEDSTTVSYFCSTHTTLPLCLHPFPVWRESANLIFLLGSKQKSHLSFLMFRIDFLFYLSFALFCVSVLLFHFSIFDILLYGYLYRCIHKSRLPRKNNLFFAFLLPLCAYRIYSLLFSKQSIYFAL